MGVAARVADAVGDFLAGIGLAAGDDNFGAELRQQFRRGTADAAARAGDDGDLAGEIERGVFHGCCSLIFSRHCEARYAIGRRSPDGDDSRMRARTRNDDLHQPAALGDAAQMVVRVAEGVFDHGQPLEVVADLGLHGHADAAMELDRLLADEFA